MGTSRERRLLSKSPYLAIKYSDRRAPRTHYPDRLVAHLTASVYGDCGSLLDLGCGRGDFSEAFVKAGFSVTAADIHDDRKAGALRVDLADPLPFPDAHFEHVFSKSVIEHLDDPLFALSEARRVLRTGGAAVILTPSWRHTGRDIFYSEYTHLRPFTRQSLHEALTLAGFTDVQTNYFWQLPVLWRMRWLRPLTLPPRLLRLPYRPLTDAPWPASVNRAIRFSREVMLIGIGRSA